MMREFYFFQDWSDSNKFSQLMADGDANESD